ncbi:hypothetical protein ASC95_08955 [Pelomonas sp. Root1217]|uniref:hypothetical protein n=1 Tax=Pelomonas sp. Root1217 TaxID=1736430 RepID=UPI00070F7268|nr:hypothetical protein [Pelomonas sp. Root1217]KQV52911.1 hypothetical protein ASC95_08955 [Pelomonas sp. Root1217]
MPTTALLLQLIITLGVARGCGWLLRYLGQPQVVGEMAAGLVLGPAVMGFYVPELHAQLFGAMLPRNDRLLQSVMQRFEPLSRPLIVGCLYRYLLGRRG